MDSPYQVRFGATVRKRRLALGWSQETLAEKSDLHRTYISDLECGHRNVALNAIVRVARGLNVSLSELFADLDAEKPNGCRVQ